jgi:hypothetical protein
MVRPVTHCPSCSQVLRVARWRCPGCGVGIDGDFAPTPLARLDADHQAFVEVFLECRGVIRDVERVLGISYPTVRARLDAVVDALANVRADVDSAQPERRAVLEAVAGGRLSPEDAVRILGKRGLESEAGNVA